MLTMTEVEHFLFFPVIVLLAIIIVVLSFKLIFRLLVLFLVLLALWYSLYCIGFAPSPWEVCKDYGQALKARVHKID